VTNDFTEYDVRKALSKACKEAGTQQAWAEQHGFSPSFVSDVLTKKRAVTKDIADALGYVKLTARFQRKGD
jgi:hypothetical protein